VCANGVFEIGDRAATGTAEVGMRARRRLVHRRVRAGDVDLHHAPEFVQPGQPGWYRGEKRIRAARAGAPPDLLGGQVAAGSGFLTTAEDGPVVRRESLKRCLTRVGMG